MKARARETGGQLGLIEADVPPRGGPLAHVHTKEGEAVYVLDGKLEFLDGDRKITAGSGDFFYVPPGIRHRFPNIGLHTARMLFLFTPVARRKASSAAATKPCPAVPLWDREHATRAFDTVARNPHARNRRGARHPCLRASRTATPTSTTPVFTTSPAPPRPHGRLAPHLVRPPQDPAHPGQAFSRHRRRLLRPPRSSRSGKAARSPTSSSTSSRASPRNSSPAASATSWSTEPSTRTRPTATPTRPCGCQSLAIGGQYLDARYVTVEGSGHFVAEEQPGALAAELERFFS